MANRKAIQYEDRLIAFVDLLGFKNAIDQSVNTDNKKEAIEIRERIKRIIDNNELIQIFNEINKQVVTTVKKSEDGKKIEEPYSKFEISFFSDCFVISCPKDEKEQGKIYMEFFMGLTNLAIQVASIGFLLRGGITFGKLYHIGNKCFGPAMNRAYLLESKTADFPRIIVDAFAVKEVGSNSYGNKSMQFIGPDKTDGLMFLDYLSQKVYFKDNDNYHDFEGNRLDYNRFLKIIRNMIIEDLIKFENDNKLLAKYQWYKEYYNDTIKKVLCQEQQDEFLIK